MRRYSIHISKRACFLFAAFLASGEAFLMYFFFFPAYFCHYSGITAVCTFLFLSFLLYFSLLFLSPPLLFSFFSYIFSSLISLLSFYSLPLRFPATLNLNSMRVWQQDETVIIRKDLLWRRIISSSNKMLTPTFSCILSFLFSWFIQSMRGSSQTPTLFQNMKEYCEMVRK